MHHAMELASGRTYRQTDGRTDTGRMHHTMELASRIDRQADGWTPATACITED